MTDTTIPGLVRAALHGEGDARFLALRTLEQILAEDDILTDLDSMQALEELARSGFDVAAVAQQALDECVVIIRPTDPDILHSLDAEATDADA